MSTKGTIEWEPNEFHFYKECFDDENVYISLVNPIFQIETYDQMRPVEKRTQELSVMIPVEMFEKIIKAWEAEKNRK
jgi:hypothetical protein